MVGLTGLMVPSGSETPEASPQPPPVLGERYVVAQRIGKGGAAGVYLVHDRNLARWRAAKVLHRRFGVDAELRTRFLREARTMARIDHPNVVRVLDVADIDVPYMVMEYVSGGCVLDWLRAHGPMPAFMAVRVLADVCKALGAVHDEGIVHRDVKPHNILVTKKGVCKLTDFGIAKLGPDDPGWDVDTNLTAMGATLGTDAFMSPEQRQDASAVDTRADVYSVGATLYTLITCKPAVDLCMWSVDHPKLAVLPAPLRDIVVKACHHRPQSRYQSVADLEDALQGVLWSLPSVPTGAPGLVQPSVALPRRPPEVLAVHHELELQDMVSADAPVHLEAEVAFTLISPLDLSTEPNAPEIRPAVLQSAALALQAPEAEGPSWQTQLGVLAAVVAAAGVLVGGGVVGSSARQLRRAAGASSDARAEFVQALKVEASLPGAVAYGSADVRALRVAFDGLQGAPDRDLDEATARVWTALRSVGLEGSAAHRRDLLASYEEAWQTEVETWHGLATSPSGSLAIWLGLADAP